MSVDDRGERRSARDLARRWPDRWWRRVGGFLAVAAIVMQAAAVGAAALPEKKLTVVNVWMTTDQLEQRGCPKKCSGTLLKPSMVLTAASCTVLKDENVTVDFATTTVADPESSDSTQDTELETETPDTSLLKKGVYIRVLKNQPTDSETQYRNVTNLYLHPLWNQTSLVANLALLKMESPFRGYGYESESLVMPFLIEDLDNMPTELKFKGFGMIATDDGSKTKLNEESSFKDLNDTNMLRTVTVQKYNNTCKGMEEEFELKWSFLCTETSNVRTSIQNTLCSNDVGGPLYNYVAKSADKTIPTLFGVFSHVYHTTHPFCATLECSVMSKAPVPCRGINNEETDPDKTKGGIFYKHTALLGRYSRWVLMTIELAVLIPTEGPTFDCPTERTETTTQSTTTDRVYDYDVYADHRFMVANQKVCPKRGGLSSSARVLRQLLPAGVVLAAVVAGLVLAA